MKKRRRTRRVALYWIAFVLLAGAVVNISLALRPAALEDALRRALSRKLACAFEFGTFDVSYRGGIEVRDLLLKEPGSGDEARTNDAAGLNDGVLAEASRVRVIPYLAPMLGGRFVPRAIVIEGLKICVQKRAAGTWNIQELLRPSIPSLANAEGTASEPDPIPEIIVEDCRVVYADDYSFPQPVHQELREFRFRLHSLTRSSTTGRSTCRFDAEVASDLARRVAMSGNIIVTPENFVVEGTLQAFKLDLHGPFDRFFKIEVSEALRKLGLEGQIDARLDFHFDPLQGFSVQGGEARLVQGRIELPGCPIPITGIQGEVSLERLVSDGARARWSGSIRGRFHDGPIEARIHALLDSNTLELVTWGGAVELPHLTLDPNFAHEAGPVLAKISESFQPRGNVGATIVIEDADNWVPDPSKTRAIVRLQGVDVRPRWFPYLLEDGHAEFHYRDGIITVQPGAKFRVGPAEIRISHCRVEAHVGGAIDVQVVVTDAPIDDRVRDACPKSSHFVWDDLQPRGIANATVSVLRERGFGDDGKPVKPAVRVEVTPIDLRFRARYFPYLVSGLQGKLVVDTKQGTIELLNVKGHHGSNKVTCDGVVRIFEGKTDLDIRAPDILVDDDFLAAIPAGKRQLLRDFDFQGRIGIQVALKFLRKKRDVKIDVDIIEASIQHVQFPFRCDLVGGHMVMENFNRIRIENFRTSEEAKPRLTFGGNVVSEEGLSKINYLFDIESLEIDERFKLALPARLERFVRRSGLTGTYSGKLEGGYLYHENEIDRNVFNYKGIDVHSTDAGINFGLKISEMKSLANFEGSSGPGDQQVIGGRIEVDRARFNRLTLDGGRVYFTFGKLHPLVTGIDEGSQYLPGKSYILPIELRNRLLKYSVSDTLQLSLSSNSLYDGLLEGFLLMDTGDAQDFSGYFETQGIDVSKSSIDVFEFDGKGVEGKAGGNVRFDGRVGEWRSLEGQGACKIQDARLAKIPLFDGFLELFNSRSAVFRELDLPFKIRNGKFHSSKIRMKSAIMSLVGSGTMNFKGDLDLVLQPKLIDVELPLIDEIFGALKKVLSEIEVKGSLARPDVKFRTLSVPITIDTSPEKNDKAGKQKRS